MPEDIFADIPKEGEIPKEDEEKVTPSESQPDKKSEEEKKEDAPKEGVNTPEDNVPFHKHPRWIERENKLKEMEEKFELTAKELAELKSMKENPKETATTKIPDWFKELYGENEVAWQKYSENDARQRAEIKREILEEQEKSKQQEVEETKKWNKWVEDEIKNLVDDPEIRFDIKNRNELIKIMLDYKPTDAENNLDFKAGYKIYQAFHKEDKSHSDARKKLADITTKTTNNGEEKGKDYQTPETLRNKTWHNL